MDKRKQQELERIFEVNFLPHPSSGTAASAAGGRKLPVDDTEPRQVPSYLKARTGRSGAAGPPAVTARKAAALEAPKPSPGQALGVTEMSASTSAPSVIDVPVPSQPHTILQPVARPLGAAPPASATVSSGVASSVLEAIPELPVPHWSRGRNTRLGSKELQVQVRRREELLLLQKQQQQAMAQGSAQQQLGVMAGEAELIPPSGIPLPGRSPRTGGSVGGGAGPSPTAILRPTAWGLGSMLAILEEEESSPAVKAAAEYFKMRTSGLKVWRESVELIPFV